MNNSEYWEQRIAQKIWGIYNSLEEKNRILLEMYQEASYNIGEELYKVAEKMKTSTPMLSDMHKFNRLNKLQNNINAIIKKLGNDIESFGKTNMHEGFNSNYEEVMESLGQIDFAMPNKELMEEMLNRPWLGSNYSERLWKNTKVLAMNLNEILTNGLTQGKTVTEMVIQLNNRMNEGFNITHRLVRTETMHYLNESSFKAYQDVGCEEVQLWAAADERTCPKCGVKHGNIYKLKDRPILPLHANCRCTYLPIIDELDANKDHDKAKENINNEFNKRSNIDNGLNNKNRKLNISEKTFKHSNEGDFSNPKNPKKIKPGEIRLKGGGHGQENIKLLESKGIEYNIVKEYSNGVRCGNVPTHSSNAKRTGTDQVWFPKGWTSKDIQQAAIYVANLKDKDKYLIKENTYNDTVYSIYKYANYKDVTVAICYDCNMKKVTTIIPDGEQRLLKENKNDR